MCPKTLFFLSLYIKTAKMFEYGNLLNPARHETVPLGVKAERQYHTITYNPSTVKAGETLHVMQGPETEEGHVDCPRQLETEL
jgi:hypothetical protein